MGFRIQNNIAALNAQSNLGVSDTAMSKSLQRLSSGFRINAAKDDAAGLAISQGFRANIASVKVAQRNITEANSLLQVAEGAMSSVGDILTRMKELATQAASANVGTNRDKVSDEYDTLVGEINRIANSTQYAGTNLVTGAFTSGNTSASWNAIANVYDVDFSNAAAGAYTVTAAGAAVTIEKNGVTQTKTIADGAASVDFSSFGISFKTTSASTGAAVATALAAADPTVVAGVGGAVFQIGYADDANSKLGVSIGDIRTATLGVALGDLATATDAQAALTAVDSAVNTLSSARASVGAYQNRLGYAAGNLSTTLENFTAAESVIRDVDMAAEMTTFTKNQILVQAGTAMLAQANQAPQQVLSLLKG